MVKIDMEMPKNCNSCPFLFYAKNCALTIRQVELNSRPDWCPLIEVKPEPTPINTNSIHNNFFTNDSCINCSNNPKNGGSGICHCILGQPKITC